VVANLDRSAERLLSGLTGEPAWSTLRGHLLLLAAAGADPVAELLTAATQWDFTSARDQAAVIDSRIQDVNEVAAGGPLPWLPGMPHRLAADPDWGPYLDARSQVVAELADQVRVSAAGEAPAWSAQQHGPVPAELIADVQVWRAANQIDPSYLPPTGPPQLGRAARIFQKQLDKRCAALCTNADGQWRRVLATEAPSVTADPFLPELEERLSNLTRAGFDATHLLRSATGEEPLPDDHPAAALWWRILDELLPQMPNQDPVTPDADQRLGARPRCDSTNSHPGRARRHHPRSAPAAETSPPDPITTPKMCLVVCCRTVDQYQSDASIRKTRDLDRAIGPRVFSGAAEGLSGYSAAGTLGQRRVAAIIHRPERAGWRQISLRERCRQGNTHRKVLRTGR
jgi:hypothetical protein